MQAGSRAVRVIGTVVVVAGLAIDAYVHLHLAPNFAGMRTSGINEGDLFRVEGWLAILAGLVLIVRPRRWTAVIAFLVAGGGAALVVLYRYVDVGAIGPVPDMYDPSWYAEKTISLIGEAVAAVAALIVIAATPRQVADGDQQRAEDLASDSRV